MLTALLWPSCWPAFILILTMSAIASTTTSAAFCTKEDRCDEPYDNQARYDYYRVYRVELETDEHVDVFQKLEKISDSLIFMGHAREVKQKLTIVVAAHRVANFYNLLQAKKVKHHLLTRNLQEKITAQPIGPKAATSVDWSHYYHLETIYAWMENLVREHPDELTLLNMGNSTHGVPIKGVKLSRSSGNKAIFIEGGIHAREWISPATATYLIHTLLTSVDEDIRQLATNYNWIVFPSINPDGYKYTFEFDRMWRKNRQLFDVCFGVDLNRNYPDHWNTTGSSSDPCRYDYAGPTAGSEVETQRLMEYVLANSKTEQIRTYISLHSYSQMIMFPFGYTTERAKNYDDLQKLARMASGRIRAVSGRNYASGSLIETIYPSSGGSVDWAYSVADIPIAYTFELRGPADSEDLFLLPAEQIQPTANEAFEAIKTIVEEANKMGYYE